MWQIQNTLKLMKETAASDFFSLKTEWKLLKDVVYSQQHKVLI